MLIAVDIDGTLCEDQHDWKNYSEAVPIPEAIWKVNSIFEKGEDEVILYTARFPEAEQVTLEWLEKYQVKYHRIIFGKFRADVYVDNCAKRMEEL